MVDYQFLIETGADKSHIQPALLTKDRAYQPLTSSRMTSVIQDKHLVMWI